MIRLLTRLLTDGGGGVPARAGSENLFVDWPLWCMHLTLSSVVMVRGVK